MAWNFVQRYQGGGAFFGPFRATHLASRQQDATYFEGEMLQAVVAGRADRARDGYRMPKHKEWS